MAYMPLKMLSRQIDDTRPRNWDLMGNHKNMCLLGRGLAGLFQRLVTRFWPMWHQI